jgi:hypothetical protein
VRVRFGWNIFYPLLRNGRLFIRLSHNNGCTRCLFRGLYLATGLYGIVQLDAGRKVEQTSMGDEQTTNGT